MRRYTKRNKNGEKLNFWLSYSDMMAALLLVFILILSCTLLETRATYEAKQAELEEKEQIHLHLNSFDVVQDDMAELMVEVVNIFDVLECGRLRKNIILAER